MSNYYKQDVLKQESSYSSSSSSQTSGFQTNLAQPILPTTFQNPAQITETRFTEVTPLQTTYIPTHQSTGHPVSDMVHNVKNDLTAGVHNISGKLHTPQSNTIVQTNTTTFN